MHKAKGVWSITLAAGVVFTAAFGAAQTAPDYGDEHGAELPADAAGAPSPSQPNDVMAGYNWEVTAEDDLEPATDTNKDDWSFALDTRGNPYLVYVSKSHKGPTADADYAVTYARRENGDWVTETQTLASRTHYCLKPTAKLDARGTPFVAFIINTSPSSYVRDQSRTLMVARRTKDGWSLTEVERDVFDLSSPALAVDGRGNPHVAYSRQKTLDDTPSLYYASWTGDRWIIETVGDVVGGWDPSLALDGRDRPHISFCNGWAIGYAHRGDAGWELYTPKETDPHKQVTDTSVAVDAAGRPYIAYRGGDDLKVLFRTDTGWETRTVDETGDVGAACALVLDDHSYPYISYRSRYHVKFAHWTGENWFVQTVAYGEFGSGFGGIDIGENTAIALDTDGVPHVCFTVDERGVGRFHVASWQGGAWRLPPGGDPDYIPDLSSFMLLTPWGPAAAALRAGEPWPAVTAGRPSDGPWPRYAAPREKPRKIAVVPAAAAVDVVEARSVWQAYVPILSEVDETAGYFLWFRVRAAGREGWLEGDAVARPDALVRFAAPYAPMRESPGVSAPAVKTVETTDLTSPPASKAAVAAGEFYPLDGRCGDWLTANGGWFPAATPGLQFYVRTVDFDVAGEEGAVFKFYFPVGDDVTRVYYSVRGPYFAPYFDDRAVLTITTRDGRSDDAILEIRANLGWHETVYHYGEAVLAEAVKSADVVAVTLTLGEPGERIRATVDPRPAWEGP